MAPDLRRLATGSTHKTIYMPDIAQMRIPLPPLVEQRRIADFLNAETARIDRVTHQFYELKVLAAERRDSFFSDYLREHTGLDLHSIDPGGGADIPVRPLNQVLRQLTNGYVGPTRDLLTGAGTRYIQSLHIKNGRIDFDRHPYYVPPEWASERPRIRLSSGDILIVQTGAVGQVALVDEGNAGASCHALLIARPDESLMSPGFLYYALRSTWGKQALEREQTGALHPHLEAGKVREIRVPVPSIAIQCQVVTACARNEENTLALESALAQQTTLLGERRQALITAAVTGQFVTTARG
jgi:type I restriction enzyme S subunit